MNRQQRKALVVLAAKVYDRVPGIACRGLCVPECGPIPMSQLEAARIAEVTGGRPVTAPEGRCSMLTEAGRCSVYDARPLICRLYGVAEGLRCPFGCEPARMLTRAQAVDLIHAATKIGGLPVVSEESAAYFVRRVEQE